MKKGFKTFFLICIFLLFTLPKVNIISIPGHGTGIRIDDIIVLFLFIYILLNNIKRIINFESLPLNSIIKKFMFYIFLCVISVILGSLYGYISYSLGLIYVIRKIEYFIFIILGYVYFSEEKDLNNLKKCFNYIIIFHLIFAIIQKLGFIGSFNMGSYHSYLTQGRISSTFNGSYEFTAFLLILLPFNLKYLFENSLKTNIKSYLKNLFLALSMIFCIAISQSRSSMVIVFFILGLMILKKIKSLNKKNKRKLYLTILVLVVSTICFFVSDAKIVSRFKDLKINELVESTKCAWKYKDFDLYLSTGSWFPAEECINVNADLSYNFRINHWMQLIDVFLKKPLFGAGPSVTEAAADGNYIRILVESGIIGLIAWSLMIYTVYKCLKKEKRLGYEATLGLTSLLLGSAFIDVFEASKVMMLFWLIVGVSLSSRRYCEKKKIKNIVIVNDFDYVEGGASKVAIKTAELLKDKYNVIFYSATNNIEAHIKGITYVSNHQKSSLESKNKFVGSINGLYNIKTYFVMKKILNKLDPDETIVHIHGWTKALSSSVFNCCFENDYKVVLTLHDYFSACPNGGFFNYTENKVCKLKPLCFDCIKCNCDSRNYAFKIYRIVRQFIQNKIVGLPKKLKHAIGISGLNIKILNSYLVNAKIVKIQNPIDFKLNYSFKKTNDYYLYLGRVTKEKGVEIFAYTMDKYNKKAIVVGEGSQLDNLKNKYKNVEFVGWKNKYEVEQYLRNARALIVPSLWYEGAPLTPLEAMSFGIPCIISDMCSGKEYIKNNGLIFNPNDKNDLIKKVELLEKDIENYSNESYNYIKEYKKNDYLKQLEKLYEKM